MGLLLAILIIIHNEHLYHEEQWSLICIVYRWNYCPTNLNKSTQLQAECSKERNYARYSSRMIATQYALNYQQLTHTTLSDPQRSIRNRLHPSPSENPTLVTKQNGARRQETIPDVCPDCRAHLFNSSHHPSLWSLILSCKWPHCD